MNRNSIFPTSNVDFVRRLIRKIARRPRRFRKLNQQEIACYEREKYSPSYVRKRIVENMSPSLGIESVRGGPDSWKTLARTQLWDLVGKSDVSPLRDVSTLWNAEDEKGTYQKIVCRGEWDIPIPMYVCQPYRRRASRAWVVCLQGHNSGMHNSIGVDKEKECFRYDVAKGSEFVKWCFENGFSALCIEQRCFGERSELTQEKRSPHQCHDAALNSLLLGRTLMGERLSDVQLGIALLEREYREDTLPLKIGVMGNSLGGSVSIYANALLNEVRFAIAGSCVCSFDESLVKIYHCADLYIPRIRQYFEFGDIVGLAAPKPTIIVQGKNDPIFPWEGCKSAINRATEIFDRFDAKSNLVVKIDQGSHRFYPDLATEAVRELGHKL